MAAQDVTADQITDGLRELGVRRGGILLVHSSLSSFGHVVGGAETVVDALLKAVGPEGTAVVPTHTWDRINADNPAFDVRRTPSGVGRITEVFRLREEAVRGLHPTHSCAAIGPAADRLMADHHRDVTPCGPHSPYRRLMDEGGQIAFLGVTLYVNTTYHALEEEACVGWLFDRFHQLWSVDPEGRRIPVPTRRHTDGLRRAFTETEPLLEGEGALRRGRIGEAEIRLIEAGPMREIILPRLAEDPFFTLGRRAARSERRRYERWRESRTI
ncbi:MAG: AAC(3) family N-acetyltransferase [Candidatus Brocadiia bacterium]